MFLKRQDPYALVVSMTGIKMGDRFLQVGCADGARLGAIAGKVGLSGRAVLVAPDESSAQRGRKGAEAAGVLVEVDVAPPTRLPAENDAFDLKAGKWVSVKAMPTGRHGFGLATVGDTAYVITGAKGGGSREVDTQVFSFTVP